MKGQKVPNQERYYQFVQSYIGGLRDGIPAIEAQVAHLDGAKKAAARSRLEWFTLHREQTCLLTIRCCT